MSEFDLSDLEPRVTDEVKLMIADLVLAWARFDALVSQALILTYNLNLDVGAILIGNMDTRAKFDRIIKLYEHFGLSGAQSFKKLRKLHGDHVDLRNSVTHAACGGTLKSDPAKIVFAPVKVMKGEVGNMLVEVIDVANIRAAAKFASENGDVLNQLVQQLSEQRSKQTSAPQ